MAKQGTARKESLYDVHPGVVMMQKWLDELEEKTGHSLEGWLVLIRKEGPKEEKAIREWLKSEHKLGANSAWWLAERAVGKGGEDTDPKSYLRAAAEYVEQQYTGAKLPMRPIYDQLLKLGRSLGDDVRVCPCKTMVPLYRNHVFGQIKPTTNSRIDLGFALAKYKGKLPKRLIDTGGLQKKDRITHRLELRSAAEIDSEVKQWLRIAYELDE